MRYGLGLIVHLTPEQRRMFRDARKDARYRVRGVSAATIASIEKGSGRHTQRTLAVLAEALGIEPEAIEKAGLPWVARYVAEAAAAVAPAPADLLPGDLGDKLRWGMTARQENNTAARLLARELGAGLAASEKTALAQFLDDVARQIRWGEIL
jgi:hypothetical protein